MRFPRFYEENTDALRDCLIGFINTLKTIEC
nr:barstar family protein [Bacillus cereus]